MYIYNSFDGAVDYFSLSLIEFLITISKSPKICHGYSPGPSNRDSKMLPGLILLSSDMSTSRNRLAKASCLHKNQSLIKIIVASNWGWFHTASSSAFVSSADNVAQAAIKFSPRAEREASSFARVTMVWLIPFIAAQLHQVWMSDGGQ